MADARRRSRPLQRRLVAAGRDVRWAVADVTSDSDRRKLFEEVKGVDILVNNAGLGERKPWLAVTIDEWRAIMTLNLEAPFALSQVFVPPMVEKKWGRVINISSIYGLIVGDPALYGDWGVDLASYVASKHGLIGLNEASGQSCWEHGSDGERTVPRHVPQYRAKCFEMRLDWYQGSRLARP